MVGMPSRVREKAAKGLVNASALSYTKDYRQCKLRRSRVRTYYHHECKLTQRLPCLGFKTQCKERHFLHHPSIQHRSVSSEDVTMCPSLSFRQLSYPACGHTPRTTQLINTSCLHRVDADYTYTSCNLSALLTDRPWTASVYQPQSGHRRG